MSPVIYGNFLSSPLTHVQVWKRLLGDKYLHLWKLDGSVVFGNDVLPRLARCVSSSVSLKKRFDADKINYVY